MNSWTTETPKKEGWYWAWYENLVGEYRYQVVKIGTNDNVLCILGENCSVPVSEIYVMDAITHWLGPLPIPDEPKG